MAGKHYTASHWGVYEVSEVGGQPRLTPFSLDPDPSPMGLDQLEAPVKRLRVARPAIRRSWLADGPGAAPELRGREPFVEVPWDEALDILAGEIDRVRTAHGNEAIFGGSYGWSSAGRFHHAQSQVHRFLNAVGGYVRHVDTYSLGAGKVITRHVAGPIEGLQGAHTSWDVIAAETELFVAFGGVPLKNSRVSPGGAGRHRVRDGLMAMGANGGRFVNIAPLQEAVPGLATEWLPIRPNSDTALMLALAHALFASGKADLDFLDRYTVGADIFRAYVMGEADGTPRSPQWAAAICGIAPEKIEALAEEMASKRTLLNVSWSLQRARHGEQPFWAVVALAATLGQIGLPGGGFGLGYGAMNHIGSRHPALKGPALPQGNNPVRAFIPVARIADLLLNPGASFTYDGGTYTYPDIRLVYWAGGNPFHHHQDIGRLRRAWQKPDTVVVHEQYWNPAARMADIVLPATIAAERNDLGFATREGLLVAMKKVAPAHAEARDDFAIFADLAARLGARETFTEGLAEMEWLARLYTTFEKSAAQAGIATPAFADFWAEGLIDLAPHDAPRVFLDGFRAAPEEHPLGTPSGKIEIFSQTVARAGIADCPGHPVFLPPEEWEAAARHPLHLVSDQPDRRLHSQLDHSAWSQDGKRGGRERVVLNPSDAAARGIQDGDVVELFNDRGRCQAVADVSARIMPGAVRLATGAWFDPEAPVDGHGNPNMLTADRPASGFSQGCAAHSCLVEVAPARDPAAPTAYQPPRFTERPG
ncbi:MAG: molybdopterin guanine dinucleotide-containing S/N-oxide reductase [Acuticoccus sp.]